MTKKKYIIWGSSGHSKVLAEIIRLQGGEILALFDSNPSVVSSLPGVPLYYGLDGFDVWKNKVSTQHDSVLGVLAIGGDKGLDRQDLFLRLKNFGIHFPTICHPSAVISSSASVGQGSHVLANSVLNTNVEIGEVCIINTGAKIDHECIIGNGVHIAPGATLCGCITVMDNVLIGAGSVVLPRLTIGRGAIVGAGAVVTKNIPDGALVVGNPARTVSSS